MSKKKPGLFDKLADAVTTRDEKEAVAAALAELKTAQAQAVEMKAKARAAEVKARAAEGRAKAAETQTSAAEAKSKAAEKRATAAEKKTREAKRQATVAETRVKSANLRATKAESRAKVAEKSAADAKAMVERLQQQLQAIAQKVKVAEETQARVYVVQSGDSLGKIAKKVWGNANRWREIYDANRDKISNPNTIRAGQELQIPE